MGSPGGVTEFSRCTSMASWLSACCPTAILAGNIFSPLRRATFPLRWARCPTARVDFRVRSAPPAVSAWPSRSTSCKSTHFFLTPRELRFGRAPVSGGTRAQGDASRCEVDEPLIDRKSRLNFTSEHHRVRIEAPKDCAPIVRSDGIVDRHRRQAGRAIRERREEFHGISILLFMEPINRARPSPPGPAAG